MHRCGETRFGKACAAGEGPGEQVAGDVLCDEVAAAQHRVVEDEAGADQHRLPVGAHDLQQADADGVVQRGDGRFVRRPCSDQILQHRVVFVVLDDFLLAREVSEECHVRHPGSGGDLIDSCCFVTLFDEQLQCVLLDGALRSRLLLGAPVVGHRASTASGPAEGVVEPRSESGSICATPRKMPVGANQHCVAVGAKGNDVAKPFACDVGQLLSTQAATTPGPSASY